MQHYSLNTSYNYLIKFNGPLFAFVPKNLFNKTVFIYKIPE